MIALDIQQGTEEWMNARIGIPTASNFDKLITPGGEPSKQATKYMYQLAVERITGKREDGFKSDFMERGIQMEQEARELYEISSGETVQTVGIVFFDEQRRYAASPDGLVGEHGGLEIKCPAPHTHVEYLLDNKVPREYIPQIQGQMLCSGRKWTDFLSYFPGLRPLIIRVERDEKFIKTLSNLLNEFCDNLEKTVEKIR